MLRKELLWGGEFWSDGKYIGTIGKATSEKVSHTHIRNQSLDTYQVDSRRHQLKLFNL